MASLEFRVFTNVTTAVDLFIAMTSAVLTPLTSSQGFEDIGDIIDRLEIDLKDELSTCLRSSLYPDELSTCTRSSLYHAGGCDSVGE